MGVFGGENKEKAEVELRLKTDQTKKELLEVGEAIKKLKKEQKELKAIGFAPDSAAALKFKELDESIKNLNKRKKDLNSSFKESLTVIINGDVANKSLQSLEAALKRVRSERSKFATGSDDFKNATASMIKIRDEIDRVNAPLKKSTSLWQGLGKEIKAFGILAGSYLGFQFLSSQVTNIISKNAKLSDSLADVQRVAGLTQGEVALLNTQLGKIDTRTGRSELLGIAVVAGKLGVAKGDIFDFTKAVDQLVVSLGDELGNADEITTQLGKILNVFKGKVTADDLTHLGNAFVELANNGVATGAFIADFTQRVSGIAKSSNLSLGATIGLAAGFEELGLKSESSATALQKLLSTIAGDIPGAAKIAGMEVAKFNELFSKNPEQALIAYAQGLVKNKQSFSEITKSFKDAGEEGARVVQTLQAIGQSGEFLSKKIDIGNTSLTNSNAIMEAFSLKNETLGAKVDKLGKALYSAFSNPAVTKAIDTLVRLLGSFAAEQETAVQSANRVLKSNAEQVKSTKALVNEYSNLERVKNRTSAQDDRMKQIAVELKDVLGNTAVSINAETGAYVLNRAEIAKNIALKEEANLKLVYQLKQRKDALDRSATEDGIRVRKNNSELDVAMAKAREVFGLTEAGINGLVDGALTDKALRRNVDRENKGDKGFEALKTYRELLIQSKKDRTNYENALKEISDIDKEILMFGYSENDLLVYGSKLKTIADKTKSLVDETKPGASPSEPGKTESTGLTKEAAAAQKERDKLAKQEQDDYDKRIANFQDFMNERLKSQEKAAKVEQENQQELDDFLIQQDKDTAEFRKNNAPQFGPDTRRNFDLELVLLEDHYNKIKGFDAAALEDKITTSRKEFEIRTREMQRGSQEYQTELAKQLILENGIIENNNKEQELTQKEHNRQMAQYVFEYVNIAQQYLQTYYNQQQTEQDAQLANDKKYHDQKVDQLNTELANKRISQEDYNKQLAGLDNEYKRKEYEANKKQFERNKRLAEANILVGAAEGIIKIWQQSSNVYVAAAESIALAGLAAYQISVIEKQEYPKYNEGGIMLEGPGHENGGIDVVSRGRKIAELQGGEVVGSREVVNDYPRLSRSIADYHKNGKQLDFSEGVSSDTRQRGLVNKPVGFRSSTAIPSFNAAMASNNVLTQKVFENGGFFSKTGDAYNFIAHKLGGTTKTDLLNSSANLNDLVAQTNVLLATINDTIARSNNKEQKVKFVQRDYEKFTELHFEAQAQTQIGGN